MVLNYFFSPTLHCQAAQKVWHLFPFHFYHQYWQNAHPLSVEAVFLHIFIFVPAVSNFPYILVYTPTDRLTEVTSTVLPETAFCATATPGTRENSNFCV